MSDLKNLQNVMWYVLACAFFGIVFFGVLDIAGMLRTFPTTISYLSEFLAGFFGIIIGFTVERITRLKNENLISERVKQNLIKELGSNKEILQDFSTSTDKGRFKLLMTTSWDMFKEQFSFKNLDVYFEIGDLYHDFIEFNSSMNYCGDLRGVEIRMGDQPRLHYGSMIKKIDGILHLLS